MSETWLVAIHELLQHHPEVAERVQAAHGHGNAIDQLEPATVQRRHGGGEEGSIVCFQYSA